MAVCTWGQRSLTWNQWTVRTRVPGTAPSPMAGSHTPRGWTSALKVDCWPLPKHPQRFQPPCSAFRTDAKTWESPGGQRGAGLQRLRVWRRRYQHFACATAAAAAAAGTQLAAVGGDRSGLPRGRGPDGLHRSPVQENSKKESKVFRIQISRGDYRDLNFKKKRKKIVI